MAAGGSAERKMESLARYTLAWPGLLPEPRWQPGQLNPTTSSSSTPKHLPVQGCPAHLVRSAVLLQKLARGGAHPAARWRLRLVPAQQGCHFLVAVIRRHHHLVPPAVQGKATWQYSEAPKHQPAILPQFCSQHISCQERAAAAQQKQQQGPPVANQPGDTSTRQAGRWAGRQGAHRLTMPCSCRSTATSWLPASGWSAVSSSRP